MPLSVPRVIRVPVSVGLGWVARLLGLKGEMKNESALNVHHLWLVLMQIMVSDKVKPPLYISGLGTAVGASRDSHLTARSPELREHNG